MSLIILFDYVRVQGHLKNSGKWDYFGAPNFEIHTDLLTHILMNIHCKNGFYLIWYQSKLCYPTVHWRFLTQLLLKALQWVSFNLHMVLG